jgi:LPXTG-motif cell wall-anchored protein
MTLTETLTRRLALAAVSGGLVALVPLAAPVASASDEYPAPVTPSPAPTVAPTQAVPTPAAPAPTVAGVEQQAPPAAPPGALPAAGMDTSTEALALVGGALAGAGVITLVLRRRRVNS